MGCGLGDAALALAEDLGDDGEVVGVDASAEMVTVAQNRASAASCHVRFSVCDALALDEPDDYFDVVRSERTLQWLTDPQAAVLEMARTLRASGMISLIDSDWSTFTVDVGDDDLAGRVREAMHTERGRPSNIGRRLPELVRAAGFEVLATTTATQTWNGWNPDQSPAPDGCFSMSSLADDPGLTERVMGAAERRLGKARPADSTWSASGGLRLVTTRCRRGTGARLG